MSLHIFELKQLVYIGLTGLGFLLLLAGVYQYNLAGVAAEPITHIITAVILFGVGTLCVFFGFETYILRDDPDIWR